MVATVLGKASAVEPGNRDAVFTYFLLRLGKRLPAADWQALQPKVHKDVALGPPTSYAVAAQIGGAVSIGGVLITMEPLASGLTVGKQYLLFLLGTTAGYAVLRADGGSALLIENGALAPPAVGQKNSRGAMELRPLANRSVTDAIADIHQAGAR